MNQGKNHSAHKHHKENIMYLREYYVILQNIMYFLIEYTVASMNYFFSPEINSL